MPSISRFRPPSDQQRRTSLLQRLRLGTQLYVLLLVAALPLCAITGYLAWSARTSAREMARDFPAFVLAVKRDAQFKVFIDGVADAVDTGALSSKAFTALSTTAQLTYDLDQLTAVPEMELQTDLALVLSGLQQHRTLAALMPLRTEIQRSAKTITRSAEGQHRRLNSMVASAIDNATHDSSMALATVLLSMMGALWIGGRLIRHILQVEQQAQEASTLNQAIMDAAPIGMMTIGADDRIVTANRACHVMHGFEPGGLIGCNAEVLIDREATAQMMQRSEHRSAPDAEAGDDLPHLVSTQTEEWEWTYVRHDGSRFPAGVIALPLHDAAGYSLGELRMVTDITERKRAAARIEHMALHDSLTGLPNRVLLQSRVTQVRARAQRESGSFALALVDLDRFKPINDTLGHIVGDEVLKIVAQRLKDAVRTSDTVVRMGGDEFALLLPDIHDPAQASEVGRKVLETLSEVLVVGEHRLQISASMGLAFYPEHGNDLVTLVRHADAAMYDAKARRSDTVVLFEDGMLQTNDDLSARRAELSEALAQGDLVLHYQPMIDPASGRVRALEALLRWQHASRGLVPPAEFIPLAEQTGQIVPIGAWVLRQACADLAALRAQGMPALRMAVNVSPRQFADEGLTETVAQALAQAGLEGSALELEITESVLMQSLSHTKNVLAALRSMGVRIAIDDFGTGYSSLSYLSHFPVQTVKVDRSFVAQIDSEHASATLACAIVSMAHSLGLEVVAEGVETGEQQQHLMKLGCELLQGFRFSRPVALQQLPTVLDRLTVQLAVSPARQAPAAGDAAPGRASPPFEVPELLVAAARS